MLLKARRFLPGFRTLGWRFYGFLAVILVVLEPRYIYPADGVRTIAGARGRVRLAARSQRGVHPRPRRTGDVWGSSGQPRLEPGRSRQGHDAGRRSCTRGEKTPRSGLAVLRRTKRVGEPVTDTEGPEGSSEDVNAHGNLTPWRLLKAVA